MDNPRRTARKYPPLTRRQALVENIMIVGGGIVCWVLILVYIASLLGWLPHR